MKFHSIYLSHSCNIIQCRFANKKVYAFLYGGTGLVLGAIFAYFNGTISTLEKRYKIPSRNTGIISIGNDISLLLAAPALTYYAGKGHRPRWMAFGKWKIRETVMFWLVVLSGLVTIIAFCMMNILPHWLYGPGEDALSLTVEYGKSMFNSSNNFDHENNELCSVKGKTFNSCAKSKSSKFYSFLHENRQKNLMVNATLSKMETRRLKWFCLWLNSSVALEFHCFIHSAYRTWTTMYRNRSHRCLSVSGFVWLLVDFQFVKLQKNHIISGITFFMRLLGPAIGYTIASMCLKLYISPTLTPTVDTSDPRWLGAWWLGWSAFAAVLIFFTVLIGLNFPFCNLFCINFNSFFFSLFLHRIFSNVSENVATNRSSSTNHSKCDE